jgi:hypothetical protein
MWPCRDPADKDTKWKIELLEYFEDGSEDLLATFEGTQKPGYTGFSVSTFTPAHPDLAEGQRCLLPVWVWTDVDQGEMKDLYYVPLEGRQDYPNESWIISMKFYVDDVLVENDDGNYAHVFINWPGGQILYPMLGAPALVDANDLWLEMLVALERPLPAGAEKFFLKTLLRAFSFGDDDARQNAMKKRTFALTCDDGWFDWRLFKFSDLGTDAKDSRGRAESDDAFALRLGLMDHYALHELEPELVDAQRADQQSGNNGLGLTITGSEVVAGSSPPSREDVSVSLPAFCFSRADAESGDFESGQLAASTGIAARDLRLCKVRVKLSGMAPGLYDLVWMNPFDFLAANDAVMGVDKSPLLPVQDRRMRDALYMASVGPDNDTAKAVDGRVPFPLDGKKQDPGDAWQPTKNARPVWTEALSQMQLHHPVSVRQDPGTFTVGHLTDIHLDVRLDIMAQNPMQVIPDAAGADVATPALGHLVNDYNATFTELADTILKGSEALVLTGDLTDYNRGFALHSNGDVDTGFVWKMGISSDADTSNYKTARNWIHFFQVIRRLYLKHKKPIFTLLGNHDYRPNPYSVYPGVAMPWATASPYPTIGGDLNLTLLEVAANYGPQFASWTEGGMQLRADASSCCTSIYSPRWYQYAINCWSDYAVVAGKTTLLMMDWDEAEDSLGRALGDKGSLLPRAANFMTSTQRSIYDRWSAPKGGCKVLCCHPTLACNSAALGIPNYDARGGKPLGDLTHGTMGTSTREGTDTSTAKSLRETLSGHVAHGKVNLVLTGHSHMDGIYSPSSDGTSVTMTAPWFDEKGQQWGKELRFPASIQNSIVVTNSGGPLGEYTERYWTRRSRPAGSVFTLGDSSIAMTHVPSQRLQAQPRRCVHDCERARVMDGVFCVDVDGPHWDSWNDSDYAEKLPGYFYYLLDPEDPTLNSVAQVAMVILADKGTMLNDPVTGMMTPTAPWWMHEVSNVDLGSHMRAKDPNNDGATVDCVKCSFSFTKAALYRGCRNLPFDEINTTMPALEVYFVLMYGGAARDNWVICVSSEIETDSTQTHLRFKDLKFPQFNGPSRRWSAST